MRPLRPATPGLARRAPVTACDLRALVACGLAVLALAAAGCRREAPPPEGVPRLVLFLVLDQGRAEYLERYRPLLTGGLGRLLEESVVFTDAHHHHAATYTAPGHATLATGLHPSHHGLVGNGWYDREGHWIYCVGDDEDGRSPRNLLAPTLGDWIKAASPRSKVFAASGKDRSAILTAGLEADGAFWWDWEEGGFTSSSYYRGGAPAWLGDLDPADFATAGFGELWEPLPEVAAAGPELGVEPLAGGPFHGTFPHALGDLDLAPGDGYFEEVYDSPRLDARLARFARALIEGEDLGGDGYVDFLGLSFSALDTVGHDYGPHSPEVLDTLLRLDRLLGELLDFLDRRIGLDRVVISLSADHGVAPVPERQAAHGLPGRRIAPADAVCVQGVGRGLDRRFGPGPWLLPGRLLDLERMRQEGVDRGELEAELRRLLEACPGVRRVWLASELTGEGSASDEPFRQLFAHSYHPDRSPDLALQLDEGYMPYRHVATNHGSPYPYDTHVPWLLRLPVPAPARITDRVYTVDVAPTLTGILGIEAPADLDGTDRSARLGSARAPD